MRAKCFITKHDGIRKWTQAAVRFRHSLGIRIWWPVLGTSLTWHSIIVMTSGLLVNVCRLVSSITYYAMPLFLLEKNCVCVRPEIFVVKRVNPLFKHGTIRHKQWCLLHAHDRCPVQILTGTPAFWFKVFLFFLISFLRFYSFFSRHTLGSYPNLATTTYFRFFPIYLSQGLVPFDDARRTLADVVWHTAMQNQT
jgi:hypothetical protein